jgi:hypothetical protein
VGINFLYFFYSCAAIHTIHIPKSVARETPANPASSPAAVDFPLPNARLNAIETGRTTETESDPVSSRFIQGFSGPWPVSA